MGGGGGGGELKAVDRLGENIILFVCNILLALGTKQDEGTCGGGWMKFTSLEKTLYLVFVKSTMYNKLKSNKIYNILCIMYNKLKTDEKTEE